MTRTKHIKPGELPAVGKPANSKGKRGRPLSENRMVHTAIVLPQGLLDDLKRDAAAHNYGVSAEIRWQLELYDRMRQRERSGDVKTKTLLNAIELLSQFLAEYMYTQWHQHPYA